MTQVSRKRFISGEPREPHRGPGDSGPGLRSWRGDGHVRDVGTGVCAAGVRTPGPVGRACPHHGFTPPFRAGARLASACPYNGNGERHQNCFLKDTKSAL